MITETETKNTINNIIADMNKDGSITEAYHTVKTVEIDGYVYEVVVGLKRKMEDEEEN